MLTINYEKYPLAGGIPDDAWKGQSFMAAYNAPGADLRGFLARTRTAHGFRYLARHKIMVSVTRKHPAGDGTEDLQGKGGIAVGHENVSMTIGTARPNWGNWLAFPVHFFIL